jgi:hypothetical protein
MNLARPGEPYGPCNTDECPHPRCRKSRRAAATACARCGRPIGYGVDYTARSEGRREVIEHVACPVAAEA